MSGVTGAPDGNSGSSSESKPHATPVTTGVPGDSLTNSDLPIIHASGGVAGGGLTGMGARSTGKTGGVKCTRLSPIIDGATRTIAPTNARLGRDVGDKTVPFTPPAFGVFKADFRFGAIPNCRSARQAFKDWRVGWLRGRSV